MGMSQGVVSGGMPGLTLKAWAIFNGTTGALIGGNGISSVTRAAAGDYTPIFTSAQPDTNYVVTVNFGNGEDSWVRTTTAKTTANFRLLTYSSAALSVTADYTPIHFAVWG